MERFYYIYLITNLLNNKQYVGSKMCDCEKSNKIYMGSSKYLNKDIELFGLENFHKIKLEDNILFTSRVELCERESYWIYIYDTLNRGYNKYDPKIKNGFCTTGIKASKEIRKKLSKSHRGQKAWNKGIPATKEAIEKNRKKQLGVIPTKKTRKKLSKAKIGKPSWSKGKPWTKNRRDSQNRKNAN